MQNRKQSLAVKSAYWLKVVSLGLVLGFGLQFAQAWTVPTQAPPDGNVAGPITTGAGNQTKSSGNINLGGGGSLYAGGLVAAPNLCIGADCRTTWPSSVGDNLGNHTATTILNLSNYDINNVSTANVSEICLNGDCRMVWPNNTTAYRTPSDFIEGKGIAIGVLSPRCSCDKSSSETLWVTLGQQSDCGATGYLVSKAGFGVAGDFYGADVGPVCYDQVGGGQSVKFIRVQ